jgi:hypothetical protein
MKKASEAELNKDPFEMEEDEFERVYNRLYSRYINPQPTNKEEEKKTLSKAEDVDSITMEEPYESGLPESVEVKKKAQSSDSKPIVEPGNKGEDKVEE